MKVICGIIGLCLGLTQMGCNPGSRVVDEAQKTVRVVSLAPNLTEQP